ncbi:MAG: DUF2062 domain-containing protein [Anaeromyxobacteraceae bacterium]|nr:DUF2062 domain-containing protein [Anaeromyxobacteraceae bacterium]
MSFLQRRLIAPLRAQLTQGVTPSRLALALALGVTIGVIPVLGATTLLAALAASLLRLNQPAIQVANYAAYPLQLGLFIPFFHAGAALFGGPRLQVTVDQLQAELSADVPATVLRYLGANLRAVAAWALVAPVLAVALHLALRPLLARLPLPAAAPGKP